MQGISCMQCLPWGHQQDKGDRKEPRQKVQARWACRMPKGQDQRSWRKPPPAFLSKLQGRFRRSRPQTAKSSRLPAWSTQQTNAAASPAGPPGKDGLREEKQCESAT